MIIGDRVKRYVFFTCSHCGNSLKVDYKELFDEGYPESKPTITCPWCEKESNTYFLTDSRYIDDD